MLIPKRGKVLGQTLWVNVCTVCAAHDEEYGSAVMVLVICNKVLQSYAFKLESTNHAMRSGPQWRLKIGQNKRHARRMSDRVPVGAWESVGTPN